jgi:translation initiation factor 4E
MWEDEHCKSGGKWAFRVPKTHTNKYWEDLLLALIGDQFTDQDEVNGIILSLRPGQDTL